MCSGPRVSTVFPVSAPAGGGTFVVVRGASADCATTRRRCADQRRVAHARRRRAAAHVSTPLPALPPRLECSSVRAPNGVAASASPSRRHGARRPHRVQLGALGGVRRQPPRPDMAAAPRPPAAAGGGGRSAMWLRPQRRKRARAAATSYDADLARGAKSRRSGGGGRAGASATSCSCCGRRAGRALGGTHPGSTCRDADALAAIPEDITFCGVFVRGTRARAPCDGRDEGASTAATPRTVCGAWRRRRRAGRERRPRARRALDEWRVRHRLLFRRQVRILRRRASR